MPLAKKDEDFALRVGLLVTDGRSRIPMPRKFRSELKKKNLNLSYVLFYCATNSPENKCEKSPFHGKITNCLRKTSNKESKMKAWPWSDLSKAMKIKEAEMKDLKVFGLWLFADSDGSNSKSKATVSQLTIQ